jgi:SAM-dependent methyltransferase
MNNDPKHVVAAGYNKVADAYLERLGVSAVRDKWFGRLVDSLPASGGRVLDLGCGAGIPVARDLAALGHAVVGVDGSAQQIVRARQNVPEATFIEADLCEGVFEADSFDARAGWRVDSKFWNGHSGRVDRRMAWNRNVLWP